MSQKKTIPPLNLIYKHLPFYSNSIPVNYPSSSTLNSTPFLKCILLALIGRRRWHPTPALLPGKSHGQKSLVGYSPWGRGELDTTERPYFHFSFLCIGEGNDNPLQCSCLENPRDGGAWWAVIYGVAQSQTRLRRLSRC